MASTAKSRAGETQKVSVSITHADLRVLRRRARRLYRGNLSAVIAEAASRMREEEGREALLDWLGDAGAATPEEFAAVRAEWGGRDTPQKRPPAKRSSK